MFFRREATFVGANGFRARPDSTSFITILKVSISWLAFPGNYLIIQSEAFPALPYVAMERAPAPLHNVEEGSTIAVVVKLPSHDFILHSLQDRPLLAWDTLWSYLALALPYSNTRPREVSFSAALLVFFKEGRSCRKPQFPWGPLLEL